MSVSSACAQACVGYGSRSECLNKVQTLVVVTAPRLNAIVSLWVNGLGFLDHTIKLMILRSLSHECKRFCC